MRYGYQIYLNRDKVAFNTCFIQKKNGRSYKVAELRAGGPTMTFSMGNEAERAVLRKLAESINRALARHEEISDPPVCRKCGYLDAECRCG